MTFLLLVCFISSRDTVYPSYKFAKSLYAFPFCLPSYPLNYIFETILPLHPRLQYLTMKTTTISTMLLAAASTASATPSGFKREIKRDAQPIRITNIDAYIYEQSEPATHFVRLNFTDPIGSVSSNCQGSWYSLTQLSFSL